ncbi:MAG: hypothetical protein NWE98_02060 [Candidatus Bathyarchaeota archaeon]|nr:hypothetical protein [Candidatus Bathyarchaeota archaeon]
MPFSYTRDLVENVKGTEKYTSGTFSNSGGSTGGTIDTGLRVCKRIFLQYTGAAVVSDAPVVNATLPCAGNAVSIVTVANTSGVWEAIGF